MSTYTPIATQTLGSAAASVTFSSIPQGYTDLVIVINSGATSSGQDIRCRFNSDTSSNYSFTFVTGNGSAASSNRATNQTFMPLDYNGYLSGSIATTTIINCMNYSNSTTYKTILGRFNTAAFGTDAAVGLWRSTSAITSIEFLTSASTFLAGSTFSLYGIQVGDKAQKAQGGNIVTSDGTYVYHTFTSSGSFTTNQALTVDYLVVAGGGGGGGWQGGGGGAGGLRSTVTATGGGGSLESALSLSSGKSYPVIVGAGGAGTSYVPTSDNATSGSNSVFSTITSTGGGKGGGYSITGAAAATGGSGGGGTDPSSPGSAGAAGTANQGYGGGNAVTSNPYNAGGGGGAGAAGGNASTSNGGAGGNGVAVAISGSSVTYAGGGGGGTAGNNNSSRTGGTGGTGGGGAGGNSTGTGSNSSGTGSAGTSGTIATGSGGGGAGYGTNNGSAFGGAGGNGGSGIVIIRYAL